MERFQILDMMGTLKLFCMRSAHDETMASGVKRQHEPPRIDGDPLQSEIAEKRSRSAKYQIAVAKLRLAKDIDDFDFTDTPVYEGQCASSRPGHSSTSSTILFWSAGPAQESPTLSIALARALIRNGARGRFFCRRSRQSA